jgi:flagellin
MSFSSNTNIASLQAQSYINNTSTFQSKTINRVTSGLRIVNSGDDAAGLAIANGLRSDQTVLTQGIRNANDGLSQLQIVDGGINNISKLLDRARSLATQSASGTFTGSRTVLNNEFSSVLQEIDRQAQSIGLNTGGSFARSLSVFIGGGKTSNGVSATANGSVAVDLSASTVDAQSLGLKGVQVRGASGTDIGTGSSTTSLAQVLANTTNANSQAASSTTRFTLRGPGFSSAGVDISVNTNGVGSTSDLVSRINGAIEAAGSAGTQSATALKNANIKASVVTDSSGRQQLAFTSPTTGFQVEAGDRTANALLGNFERNAVVTGTNTAVKVDTNGGTNGSLQLKFNGGSTQTFTLTDNGSGGSTSKGSIVAQLNANSTFASSAVASLDGNQVVIRSKSNTSTSQIEVVTTGLSTQLGLTGQNVTAASASTGADVQVKVQGSRAVPSGGVYVATTGSGTTETITGANNAVSFTVAGVTQAITLTQGVNLTKQQIADDINTSIAAGALNNKLRASVLSDGQTLAFTALNAGDSVTVETPGANSANTDLGLVGGTVASSNVFLNSDTIRVRIQGGSLDSPVELSLNQTTGGTTTVESVLTDLTSRVVNNSSLQSAGITLSTAAAGNNLVFKSASGESFEVSVTGDSENKLGFGSFVVNASNEFDYSTITSASALTPAFERAYSTQTATLEVSLNGGAGSSNAINVTQLADRAIVTGTARGAGAIASATGNLIFTVGATTVTTSIVNAATLNTAVAAINTAITGAGGDATGSVAELVGTGANTQLRIRSAQGANTVVISATSSAAALADLGLTANQTATGNSVATVRQDIADQINTAISGDAELRNAGLRATIEAGGELKLASSNGTNFRVQSFSSQSLNLGFGTKGSSYTGATTTGAPATSATLNSGGANQSQSLAFSPILFGGDDQAVSITASDTQGVKQSLSVTLRNDATARSGRTIDEAVKTINDSLQQSNNETLKRIFAVKENAGGSESIRFVSTVQGFEVGIGATAGGTGFSQPTGGIDKSAVVGTGSNSSIDSQSAAEAAVEALSDAVTALGNAQAVVGRGQNQFSYAVNLAQSQLTNLAASESRIRDADLAQEAANLSKAQIQLQAGIAALAQANSAPQQVLSLLRG